MSRSHSPLSPLLPVSTLRLALLLVALAASSTALADAAKDAQAPDMRTRRAALNVLTTSGDAASVGHLIEAARAAKARGDAIGVRDVASSLKDVKNPAAAPALQSLVEKERASGDALSLVLPAVDALGALRDPTSAPLLRAIADDPASPANLRREAEEALARSTSDPADVARYARALKDPKTRDAAARAIAEMEHPALAPALVPLLTDPDVSGHDVARVIAALGHMASPVTAVPLMDVVERDTRAQAVSAAGQALVTVVEPEHLPRLTKLIEAQRGSRLLHKAFVAADRRQAYASTTKLLRSNPTLATELLYTISGDVHPSDEDLALAALATPRQERTGDPLRRGAIEILTHTGSARAETTLCKELKDKGNTSSLRQDCVTGLRASRSDSAIACLIDVLDAESKLKASGSRQFSINIHEDVTRSLEDIAGERFGPDAGAFRTWHASGMKSGVDGLIEALGSGAGNVRELAATRVEARAKKGVNASERKKFADAIAPRIFDERQERVRIAMVRALGALGDRSTTDALVRLLEKQGKKSFDEKVELARALDRLGDGRGTASLIEDLASDDDATRANAARALSVVTGEPLHHDATKWRAWWKTYAERYRAP